MAGLDGLDGLDGFSCSGRSRARDRLNAGKRSKPSNRPNDTDLHTDDVVWFAEENPWIGRTSPKLTKRARRDLEERERFQNAMPRVADRGEPGKD
jgi:hypothetical protein